VHDHEAIYLMAFGGLLLAEVLLDDLADRVKLPGILLVLALGLLVDNDLRSPGAPCCRW
jgi:CPA1 family monovalent cation:H+ antiporter/cell volume regulation protein A